MNASIQKEPISRSDDLNVVRLRVAAGAAVPEHHSNVDVVVTVVRGTGSFTVEGTSRPIGPGQVVVMRPRARHSISASSDLELVVVHARLREGDAPASCGA
jgi:quercetin dioxygenase-like cupin family protein